MRSPILIEGLQHLSDDNLEQARVIFNRIIDQNDAESLIAFQYLAYAYSIESKYFLAIDTLKKAHEIFDTDYLVLAQLAEIMMKIGDYDQAIAYAKKSLLLNANNPILRINLAAWQASRTSDPIEIRNLYESWCRDYLDPHAKLIQPFTNKNTDKNKKLKIGYVSGDLKNHAIRYFIEPYLKHHNHQEFEIHAFMTQASDPITSVLKKYTDYWHDVQEQSIEDLFQLIQSQDIDVLVDLSGHSEGERLEVFARRAAPIQLTWYGFVQTLGMQQMDYRLTDSMNCPDGSDAYYTESLYRLQCFTAYEPPLSSDDFPLSPWKKNSYVTMISLNHSRKVSDDALILWRDVLKNNPKAKLIIVSTERTQEGANAIFFPRLERLALPLDRIEIKSKLSMRDFMRLAFYADFALDSTPISGGVTTFHSLWMGLPVLTMQPEKPISLFSYTANILRTLGLDGCIADNPVHFQKLASNLINQPELIDALRAESRQRVLASPYLDHVARTNELELAYRQLWHEYTATVN
jgi:predicted O-linked N-acetylglucosamine transferase (SPINDLY family)